VLFYLVMKASERNLPSGVRSSDVVGSASNSCLASVEVARGWQVVLPQISRHHA
jgi:hypothetical protein